MDKETKSKYFAKIVADEREKLKGKKRAFVKSKNADEADGVLPTLEDMANGYKPASSDKETYRIRTKEEILESGTLVDKVRLLLSSDDLSRYYGMRSVKLSSQEKQKITASIKSKEDKDTIRQCFKEYATLIEFGKLMHLSFKNFQTSYGILAVSLNKWISYERTAEELTKLCKFMETRDPVSKMVEESDSNGERIKGAIFKVMPLEKGNKIVFNEEKQRYEADIFGSGGLYSRIKQEAKEVEENLADFKAHALVAEEYINKSTLQFMPTSIEMSLDNAIEERYTRYLVEDLSFFRSELNERKEKGETVTPDDERRAVIPDYYEIKPMELIYWNCKRGITLIEDGKA